MLTIKNLKLKNFLSHSDTEIPFEDEQRCLIDGISGAGKSAIVESIIWVLYGKGRSDNRFLIKSGEKSGEVELLLRDQQIAYRIVRKITEGGKQTLLVDIAEDGEEFEPLKVSGLKNIQDWMESTLLKASYTLFINSIAYPQDNTENFVKQSANKRKDLLLEIAGAGDYDLLYGRARDRLSLEEESLARVSSKLEDKRLVAILTKTLPKEIDETVKENLLCQGELVGTENLLEKISNQISGASEIQKRRALLADSISKSERRAQELSNAIEKTKARIEELKSIDMLFLSMKMEELKIARQKLSDLQLLLDKELLWNEKFNKLLINKPRERDFETEINKLNRSMIDLVKNTDVTCPAIQNMACPKLEASLKQNSDYFEAQIMSLRKSRDEQNAATEIYVKSLEALGPKPVSPRSEIDLQKQVIMGLEPFEVKHNEAKAAKMTIASLEEGLKNSRDDMSALNQSFSIDREALVAVENEIKALNIDNLQMDQASFKRKRDELKLKNESLLSKIAEKKTMLKMAQEAQDSLKELEEQAKGYNERIEALKAVKDAFGGKGIRTVIIDYFVPRLEERINEILSQLSDFRVEINTQRDGADGESVIEGLFINIIDAQGRCMEFNSYSGGERLKVVVAISEALASLQRIGFRILDELFIGLDQESTESFAEVLSKIQNRFKQLLCISHLQAIKEVFSSRIEVIKQNGTSVVIT